MTEKQLVCYSPGDGALAFAWQVGVNTVSEKVSEEEVIRFQEHSHTDRERILIRGYWRLLRPIRRKDESTLLLWNPEREEFDEVFYSVSGSPLFLNNLKAEFVIPEVSMTRRFPINNFHTKAQVLFFLRNEQEIEEFRQRVPVSVQ